MIYTFNGDINKGIIAAARRRNAKNGKSGRLAQWVQSQSGFVGVWGQP
jgi:hypothetical protein